MAELLIALNPKDTAIERGDIIAIRNDGFEWGNLECLNVFIVVKIDGTASEHIYLTESQIENETVLKKRKYYIEIESALTEQEIEEIQSSDWLVPEIPYSEVKDKADL